MTHGQFPSFSNELIPKFLSRVHSFTTVGLEAQATAFSFGEDGAIKYLALLPQRNKVSTVTSQAENKEDELPPEIATPERRIVMVEAAVNAVMGALIIRTITSAWKTSEFDAVDIFEKLDLKFRSETYISRCGIHTHPRFKAFMSSLDIYQLYGMTQQNPRSFGIVLSPRGEGLKALCVHLAQDQQEAQAADMRQYTEIHIHESHTKFCCQIQLFL